MQKIYTLSFYKENGNIIGPTQLGAVRTGENYVNGLIAKVFDENGNLSPYTSDYVLVLHVQIPNGKKYYWMLWYNASNGTYECKFPKEVLAFAGKLTCSIEVRKLEKDPEELKIYEMSNGENILTVSTVCLYTDVFFFQVDCVVNAQEKLVFEEDEWQLFTTEIYVAVEKLDEKKLDKLKARTTDYNFDHGVYANDGAKDSLKQYTQEVLGNTLVERLADGAVKFHTPDPNDEYQGVNVGFLNSKLGEKQDAIKYIELNGLSKFTDEQYAIIQNDPNNVVLKLENGGQCYSFRYILDNDWAYYFGVLTAGDDNNLIAIAKSEKKWYRYVHNLTKKEYVDEGLNKKVDKLTAEYGEAVYANNGTKDLLKYYTPQAKPFHLVVRDEAGKVQVQTPNPSDNPLTATNKHYVDTLINKLEEQSDVVDVIPNYQALVDYDKSKITNNDLVKVLQDETHENAITYYRLVDDAWIYIGQLDPYYNTTQIDRKIKEVTDDLDSLKGNVQDYYSDGSEYKLIYRGYRFVVSDGEENPSKIETKSNEEEVTIYSPLRGIIISNKNELLALQAFKDAALGAINTYGAEINTISNRLITAEGNAGGAFAQAKIAMEVASKAEGIIDNLETQVDYLEKKVDTLEKANAGTTYDLMNYNASGYIADLGKNALAVNLNKIGGVTEKSENLLVLEDVPETTKYGITYSIKDGEVTINGTPTRTYVRVVGDIPFAQSDLPLTLNIFTNNPQLDSKLSVNINGMSNDGNVFIINKGTINNDRKYYSIYFRFEVKEMVEYKNYKVKPMVVRGSTAPTEFKQGYNGLRYQEVQEVINRNENLLVLEDVAEKTKNGVTYSVKDGVFTFNGTATDFVAIEVSIKPIFLDGTYSFSAFNDIVTNNGLFLTTSDNKGNIVVTLNQLNAASVPTRNKIEYIKMALYFEQGTILNNNKIKPMIVRGSVVPTEFKVGREPQVLLADKITEIKNHLVSLDYDENVLGYGVDKDNCNYIDFERKKAVIKFARIDLGTITNWIFISPHRFYTSQLKPTIKVQQPSTLPNLVCDKYTREIWQNVVGGTDMAISLTDSGVNAGFMSIVDSGYDNVELFKQSLTGKYLVYELANPTEVDLSLILTDDDQYIPVEGGGSLTFENEHKADLPYDFDAYEKIAAGGGQ